MNQLPPPTGVSTTPTPTAEEAVAITAAMEALWPRVAATDDAPSRSRAWRFSGRWWNAPVPARRARPYR